MRLKRLLFVPSPTALEYFDRLLYRLTEVKRQRVGVRATQRETFDHLVELARAAEAANLGPALQPLPAAALKPLPYPAPAKDPLKH